MNHDGEGVTGLVVIQVSPQLANNRQNLTENGLKLQELALKQPEIAGLGLKLLHLAGGEWSGGVRQGFCYPEISDPVW